MAVAKELFGKTHDGKEVLLFTLSNTRRMMVKIINYGCIITAIQLPNGDGTYADVVLGFNDLEQYLAPHPHFGSVPGRFANRIAGGRFALDGQEYRLALNDGQNHLHGGDAGFDRKVWDAAEVTEDSAVGVELSYLSQDGEEGYPGNLRVKLKYLLTEANELKLAYEAVTDQPTIVNLTNHSYFNLQGEGSGNILGHELMINADSFTPVGEDLIPTGDLQPVANSPLDFTKPRPMGSRIKELKNGYDHNYVLNKQDNGLSLAAKVYEPTSQRGIEVYTTEPGMQLYTANFLDGTWVGKSGRSYGKQEAFCLETQHFPDSPNHPGFPPTRLNPGETYRQVTIYKFIF